MPDYREVNFDGLIGPSHHFGGLSFGNKASMAHRSVESNPRLAALQGLEKMWALAQEGLPQAVLPPVERPNLTLLTNLGLRGSPSEMIATCARELPELLSPVWSASSMWAANAATVIPSLDNASGQLCLVPANLAGNLHRSTETLSTARNLRTIFADKGHFAVPPPVWAHPDLGDEGAANHTRLYADSDGPGLHFFVHGRSRDEPARSGARFPARQTELASRSVARIGGIDTAACVFARQSDTAIEAGVFHNDVIAVGNADLLFCHQAAYADQNQTLVKLCEAFQARTDQHLKIIEVPESSVSLNHAVQSYLFNSQLISLERDSHLLVVPIECRETPSVWHYLEGLVENPACPIARVLVQDLRQSMRNGGGPACLRLRVTLSAAERAAITGRIFLDAALYRDLKAWIEQNYRESLDVNALADPGLLDEVTRALKQLEAILDLPGLYPNTHH